MMLNMSASAKKELEALQKTLYPFTKKISRYTLFSLPLLAYSVISLVFSLFFLPDQETSITMLVIYAALGAIGIALYKEAKAKRKEVQKLSVDYITDRIKRSDSVSENLKDDYVKRVKEQPVKALYYFVEFLEKEERLAGFQ